MESGKFPFLTLVNLCVCVCVCVCVLLGFFLFVCFFNYWVFNSGPHTCKVSALPVEPLHQSPGLTILKIFVYGSISPTSCPGQVETPLCHYMWELWYDLLDNPSSENHRFESNLATTQTWSCIFRSDFFVSFLLFILLLSVLLCFGGQDTCHVAQGGLKPMCSRDSSTSTSQVVGNTGMCHLT
jgi:NADH:ubiquinone oxidoreductase subunit 3 (subunit A)